MTRMLERYLGRPFMAPEGAANAVEGNANAGAAAQAAAAAAAGASGAQGGEGAAGANGGAGAAGQSGAAANGAQASAAAASVDWRDSITDPDLRKFAENLASPSDAVKAAREMRQQLSTRVKLPGKDAKPEEVTAFAKAIGAGEKVEEYVAAFPKPAEGEPSDTDKLVQSKVAEVLHKHHVPIAATAELHGVVAEIAAGIEAEQERVAVKARDDSLAELRKEWGADFDGNKALASRAALQFGGQPFLDWVSSTVINGQKLGDHPMFIKVFGTVGRRTGEGTFIGAVDPTAVKSLDDQINAFYAKYPPGSPGYAQNQPELQAMFDKRYGTAPIHGSAG